MRVCRCIFPVAGIILGSSLISPAPAENRTISYPDLVRRLVDLERLAVIPEPGERTAQWSTYNRASRYDEKSGRYVDWDMNGDAKGFIREEGGQIVLAEMKGPGCIWRIWTASPAKGHMRIFIDGAAVPAIDLPFAEYFDGRHEPFVFPSLVYRVATGYDSYVPIPYGKSCKVIADRDWGRYCHITYSTFPRTTRVSSYSPASFAQARPALAEIDVLLAEGLGRDPKFERAGGRTVVKSMLVRPGELAELARLQGPGAIAALKVRVTEPLTEPEWAAGLREMTLELAWDDEPERAVWTPLGDFFGTAPGFNRYTSFPAGMKDNGFYSYWFMPFAKSARVRIGNDGARTYPLEVEILQVPLPRPVDRYARFHAKWHRDVFLPEDPDRAIDWPMLVTRGKGRFCGVHLHIWTPKGGWWGEGDEKFFVDDEKFPSTFGTGSEDYFGYAWGIPELFARPFHNQTLNRNNNQGHVSVNRWHVADSVPFQTAFEGAIEKYPRPELGAPDEYSCTSYWYLAPGGEDRYGPIALQQRTGYYEYLVPRVAREVTRFNAMNLLIDRVTGGKASWWMRSETRRTQPRFALSWEEACPGDRLALRTLAFEEPGNYQVSATLRGSPKGGLVKFFLDGNPAVTQGLL